MRLSIILSIICLPILAKAQCFPLVPNGGFEEFSSLPTDDCDWALAVCWTNAATSSDCNSNNGTPDYYHLQGSGPFGALPTNYYAELNPFEGSAVMGLGGNLSFLTDAREYISIQLSSPLVATNEYELRFSMNCGVPLVGGNYADGWGALLTQGPVYQTPGTNDILNASGYEFSVPGVFSSQEWQTFTFTFTADQTYDHLTLGNFFTDAQQTITLFGVQDFAALNYVFFDDIQIIELGNSNLTVNLSNVEVCPGQAVVLEADAQGGTAPYTYTWSSDASNSLSTESFVPTNNELVQVTVTDCNGNTAQTEAEVSLLSFELDLGADIDLCNGPIILNAFDPVIQSYSWNTEESTSSINVNLPGTYSVNANWECGVVSDEVIVNACPQMSVSLGPDQFICQGENTVLLAVVTGGTAPFNFEWSISNAPNANTFTVDPQQTSSFSVSVTDAAGNIDSDEVLVTVVPAPSTIDLGEDILICPGDVVILDGSADGALSYKWNNGSTTAAIEVSEPGFYSVEINSECATVKDSIEVISGSIDVPEFSSNVQLCDGIELAIGPTVNENTNFIWQNESALPFPRTIDAAGLYTFSVIDFCGERTFEITATDVICDCDIYVPNTFTPNFDGINDVFSPEVYCEFTSYEFSVFNRWGEKLFQTDNPKQKWTGGVGSSGEYYVPDGVYTWQLIAQPTKGIKTGELISYSGTVQVLR